LYGLYVYLCCSTVLIVTPWRQLLFCCFVCGYRLVDEGKVNAEEVCVFEMTERVGGRLFSLRGLGPDSDLSVDAGGYRTVRFFGCVCFGSFGSRTLFRTSFVWIVLCCVVYHVDT
jgi:hypothetical protein